MMNPSDAVNFYQQQEMAAHKKCDELQAQLAERDTIVLEQQARIEELRLCLIDTYTEKGGWDVEAVYQQEDNLSALEAALKAERIKTLEDAAFHMRYFDKAVTD